MENVLVITLLYCLIKEMELVAEIVLLLLGVLAIIKQR
jgi:hypothetical protein